MVVDVNARFWANVRVGGSSDCWEWQGPRSKNGYGRIGLLGQRYAHRAAYLLTNGTIPDGAWILHSCDNPPCVNPSHLHTGTPQENVDERCARGRSAKGNGSGWHINPSSRVRGERCHQAKLTAANVLAIRRRYASGEVSRRELAQSHGITADAVSKILRGERWAHVEGPIATTGKWTRRAAV